MPVYMCRWPNGDFSFVSAYNRPEAEMELDELHNAEGCPFLIVDDFMVHFYLADDGSFRFESFGESTNYTVWKRYPALYEAFAHLWKTDPKFEARAKTPEQHQVVGKAVKKERTRVKQRKVRPPRTLMGQEVKGAMGAPWSLIEYWINKAAEDTLKNSQPTGKPN